MAYKNLAKADSVMDQLADRLTKRLAANSALNELNTVRKLRDSDGWPMIILSKDANEAAGEPVVGLRLKAIDAGSKDILGGDLHAFAPHTMEIAHEDAQVVPADLVRVSAEAAKMGAKIKYEKIAAATAVTAAAMSAATDTQVSDDIYWPNSGV